MDDWLRCTGTKYTAAAIEQVADKVRFHVGRANLRHEDAEDCAQNVKIVLINAWRSYRPGCGASWETYADRCIINAVKRYLRQIYKAQCVCSLDAIAQDDVKRSVPVNTLSVSPNPTQQRRVRLTADAWEALDFLAAHQKIELSLIMQQAIDIFIYYCEREASKNENN